MFIGQIVFAKKYSISQELSGAAITGQLTAYCDGYSVLKQSGAPALATTVMARGFVLEKPYALIQLSIPQSSSYPASATATVDAVVNYEYEVNGQIVSAQKNIILTVSVNSTGYRDIDYVKVEGALKAEVIINQSSGLGTFSGIKFSVSCEGNIYRFINPSFVVQGVHYTSPPTRTDGSLADGNLYVSWDVKAEAEGYELEWTYVSNQGATELQTLSKADIYLRDYLFRNNSSRVVTQSTGYFIPLVYEKGLIIFRVRAIGKNLSNGVLTDVRSEWSIIENQTSLLNVPDEYIFTFSGLETNLNWQSSISFAEEGKNKASVSYHDGSLRNRQTVTRMNTDQHAIAGETLYDYNGRPVIQTLPAPIDGSQENNLNYRRDLNIKDGGTKITKSDYDAATPGSTCTPVAPQLSTVSGASEYYSSQNGQDILNKEYIPDAKKYPYTQTHYTNDNTGRISIQSGVGDAHKMGSGHETRYMYGAPLQSEISRLFGNQVGLSGHYKKNTVIDANGQVSVSYLDLDGKVIATALAGNNNTGLDNLNGDNTRTVSSNLISDASNIVDSDHRGKTMQYAFTVTTPSTYTFDYEMTAGIHTVSCTSLNSTSPVELKLAGVFDATISLYTSCNVPVFSDLVSTTESFGITATAQVVPYTRTVDAEQMQVGEYRLVKSVRINQTKLNDYLTKYLSNNTYTCVLTDDHFQAHAFDDIDFSGCGITCTECKQKIDDLIEEVESKNVSLSAEEKSNLYDRCNTVCLESITCLSSLYAMTGAMSPDGQYGKVRGPEEGNISVDVNNQASALDPTSRDASTNSDPSITPELFPMSIFNATNTLQPNLFLRTNYDFHRADWRRPIKVTPAQGDPLKVNFKNQRMFSESLVGATYSETEYMDENGQVVYVTVQKISATEYFPAVLSGVQPLPLLNQPDPDLYKVTLTELADVREFLRRWQPHFANYLVPYHPEFSYYIECTGRSQINDFEEKLVALNNPAEDDNFFFTKSTVSGVDYYTPVDFTQIDPLFLPGTPLSNDQRNGFINKLTRYRRKANASGAYVVPEAYYTMAQAATISVNCPVPTADCKKPDCESGIFAADDIEEWSAFRSFYLNERQKLLREVSTRNAIEGRYYNGCIGNLNFSGSAEEQIMRRTYVNTPSVSTLISYADAACAMNPPVYPAPYSDWQYGHHWIYGWRYKNYCESRHLYPGTFHAILRRFNSLPLTDPNQTCNTDEARLYKNKIRAFYPQVANQSPIGGSYENCYEILKKADGTYMYVQTDCNAGMLDQGAIVQDASKVREYNSCGLCPITNQVKDLITTLISNNILNGTATDFNCFAKTPNFALGQELQSYINNSLISDVRLDYSSSYVNNKLTGTITPQSLTGNNPLYFVLDFTTSGLPVTTMNTEATRKDLLGRMQIASITKDATGLNTFTLKMYVNLNRAVTTSYDHLYGPGGLLAGINSNLFVPAGNQTVYRYEFTVPGTISYGSNQPVDLMHCSFNPVCVTSTYPTYVMNLLNTLTYTDNTVIDENTNEVLKPYNLVSSSPLAVLEGDIYDFPVRYVIGKTAEDQEGTFITDLNPLAIQWTSSVTGGMLSGTLAYTEEGTAKTVEISVIPKDFSAEGNIANAVNFNSVKFFANIRPFDVSCTSAGTCNSNKFLADAVTLETIEGQPANVFHRVVIEVVTKTAGVSDGQQPVSTSCTKIAGQ